MEHNSIIISQHAQERIISRLKIPKSKIPKIVLKALLSKENIPPNYINKKEYIGHAGIYKYFLGNVFIFDKLNSDHKKIILVTVYKI